MADMILGDAFNAKVKRTALTTFVGECPQTHFMSMLQQLKALPLFATRSGKWP